MPNRLLFYQTKESLPSLPALASSLVSKFSLGGFNFERVRRGEIEKEQRCARSLQQ